MRLLRGRWLARKTAMAHDRPTPALPTRVGWYVVWTRAAGGRFLRHLYLCFNGPGGDGRSSLWAKPLEDEAFTPTSDARFLGALWHGPFQELAEASVQL